MDMVGHLLKDISVQLEDIDMCMLNYILNENSNFGIPGKFLHFLFSLFQAHSYVSPFHLSQFE